MISDIAFAGSSAADDEVDFCVKTLQYSSVIIAVLSALHPDPDYILYAVRLNTVKWAIAAYELKK